MRARQNLALIGALGIALLSACSQEALAPASELPDGTYVGSSEPDSDGAFGNVTFTVSGGQVSEVSFYIQDADGTIRDDNYGLEQRDSMPQVYEENQNALAAEDRYMTAFEETGDQNEVDLIAGSSVSYRAFVAAIEDAVEGAVENVSE